ncbi:MAG: hypothetical protein WC107_00735 [Patescibacteria group bacterium]
MKHINKKIAVDLDDVLNDLTERFFDFHNQKFNTSHKITDISKDDPNGLTILDPSYRKIGLVLDEFFLSPSFDKILPRAEAQSALLELKKNGFGLTLVTSRPDKLRKKTSDWLDQHFPKVFDEIYFSSHKHLGYEGKSKGEICNDLNADILVEDLILHAEDCADKNVFVLLYDTPWNQPVVEHKNIKRVYNWREISNLLIS